MLSVGKVAVLMMELPAEEKQLEPGPGAGPSVLFTAKCYTLCMVMATMATSASIDLTFCPDLVWAADNVSTLHSSIINRNSSSLDTTLSQTKWEESIHPKHICDIKRLTPTCKIRAINQMIWSHILFSPLQMGGGGGRGEKIWQHTIRSLHHSCSQPPAEVCYGYCYRGSETRQRYFLRDGGDDTWWWHTVPGSGHRAGYRL